MPKSRQPKHPKVPESPEISALQELIEESAGASAEDERRPERRARRQTLIEQMIAEQMITTQARLQELLEKQGLLVTQSSISRDLRDLGVRRVKGIYVLQRKRGSREWGFEDAIGLVETVTRSGSNLAVIQTIPRAAPLVAHALEAAGWEELAGIVAGEDTLFLATRTQEDQDRLFQRLKKYMKI